MQIEIENLKYDESRHEGHAPENAEEKMVWTVLDAVDELFIVVSANLVVGPVSDGYKRNVPPGTPKARKALADALATYVKETMTIMDELKALDLISED